MSSLGSLHECLAAAVQLKTGLIKSKPGRQKWEQAPPFLRCTAAAEDSVQRARADGFSIQYSTAFQLKEQGNKLVGKDADAALDRYTQAIAVFLWFDRGPDRAAEDLPLVCSADLLQGREQEQAYHLLAVCFSNAASCLLQLGRTADASYACSKALEYDPYNVKSLYRRALAHRRTGYRSGLEAAVVDLVAANQLEPANKQVHVALVAVQQELREHVRRERDMYGNIFLRGELYGDHASAAAGTGTGPAAPINDAPHDLVDDGPEIADGGGLDPENLLFLDPKARKAESTLASREADLVMRKMQVALARTRTRKMTERLNAEQARRGARFPWWSVPWWAYALIGLHLAYRLLKIWQLPPPLPSGGPSQNGAAEAAMGLPAGHVEL